MLFLLYWYSLTEYKAFSLFTHFILQGKKDKQFAKLRHSGLFIGKSNATLKPNSNSTEIKKTRSTLSVDRHTEETLCHSVMPNIWESSCQSCHCLFQIENISKEGSFCLANNSVKGNLFLAYNGFILQHDKKRLYSQQATQTPVNTAETP